MIHRFLIAVMFISKSCEFFATQYGRSQKERLAFRYRTDN